MPSFRYVLLRSLRAAAAAKSLPSAFSFPRSIFSSAEAAAASRRQIKRKARMQPPSARQLPDPAAPRRPSAFRREPNLPDTTSDLVGPRLNLHNRVQSLIRAGDPDAATAIARSSVSSPTRPTVFTCNAVISAMVRAHRHDDAGALFSFFFNQSRLIPNVFSYNLLIESHCASGRVDVALDVYRHIIAAAPFSPSPLTYRLLTKALVDSNRIADALDLLRESHHRGQAADSLVYNNLISGYLQLDDFPKAHELLAELRELSPCFYDGVIHASFMEAYFNKGMEAAAMESYHSFMNLKLHLNFQMSPSTGNSLLQALLKHGKHDDAKKLFDEMLNSHFPNYTFTIDANTYNIMVNHYFSEGKCAEALALFNRFSPKLEKSNTKEKKYSHLNVGCFNNIIGKLCENGLFSEAKELFDVMPEKRVKPDTATYRLMIDSYFGGGSDTSCFNGIISMFCEDGQVSQAEALLNEMLGKSVNPNVDTYGILIDVFCRGDQAETGLRYLEKMVDRGLKPTTAIYGGLIAGLCIEGQLEMALALLDKIVNDVGCFNEIIGKLCENMLVAEAEVMFDRMPGKLLNPDTTTYGIMMYGFCRLSMADVALQYLEKMVASGLKPTPTIYGILVSGLCGEGNMDRALVLLEDMVEDVSCFNGIIDKLCENGLVSEAEVVFNKMPDKSVNPEAATYDFMIGGFCRINKVETALCYLEKMVEGGLTPIAETYQVLVSTLYGLGRDMGFFNRIIVMLCDQGLVSGAEMLLAEMPGKSLVPNAETYGIMIDGYCRVNKAEAALQCLNKMVECQLRPTGANYGVLVTGLCKEGKLDVALALLEEMVDEVFSFNGIISKLCENGLVSEAEVVFDKMPGKSVEPNTNTYGFMIDGFCRVNRVDAALRYLEKIGESGLKPTAVSYGILVTALCREGNFDRAVALLDERVGELGCFNGIISKLCENMLVAEAEVIFNKMLGKSVYPDAATYKFIIDGLCRVNRTEDALSYLEKMVKSGLKPTAASYETLITEQCREGNFDRVQYLLREMFRWDYVLVPEFRDSIYVAFDKAGRSTELEQVLAVNLGNSASGHGLFLGRMLI